MHVTGMFTYMYDIQFHNLIIRFGNGLFIPDLQEPRKKTLCTIIFLNQALAGLWLASAWFLIITFVRECMHVCMYVCTPLRP